MTYGPIDWTSLAFDILKLIAFVAWTYGMAQLIVFLVAMALGFKGGK